MINLLEFNKINLIQASLFITNFSFSTSRILKTVLEQCSEQFDGDPTVLPLPDDAPKEIPRIVFERKDKSIVSYGTLFTRLTNSRCSFTSALSHLHTIISGLGSDQVRLLIFKGYHSKNRCFRALKYIFRGKTISIKESPVPELHTLYSPI